MENKFCFSEQKTTNILKSPAEELKRANKRGKIQQQQQQQQDKQQQKRHQFEQSQQQQQQQQQPKKRAEQREKGGTDREKDYTETELPVVLSSSSSSSAAAAAAAAASAENQRHTSVFNRNLLSNVTSDYLKLVNSIECRLSVPLSSGLRVSGGSGGSALVRQQGESQSKRSIGFVELCRRQLYYESLGLPLTALELIAMAGCDCNWESKEAAEDELPPQPPPQPQSPTPSQQEKVHLAVESETGQRVLDSFGMDHTRNNMMQVEERRLPGGYRRPNCICVDIDEAEVAESSSKTVDTQWSNSIMEQQQQEEKIICRCGQELYDSHHHEVPSKSSNRSYDQSSQYYDNQQEINYNSPIFDQIQSPAIQINGDNSPCTCRSHTLSKIPLQIETTEFSNHQSLHTAVHSTLSPPSESSQLPTIQNAYKSQMISQVKCPTTVQDSHQGKSLAQTEFPVDQTEYKQFQINPRKYELQTTEFPTEQCGCHKSAIDFNEFPQIIPSEDQRQCTYKTFHYCQKEPDDFQSTQSSYKHQSSDQNELSPSRVDHVYRDKGESHCKQCPVDNLYKNCFQVNDNCDCGISHNPSIPHPRSASVVPEEWHPQIPLIRNGLTSDIIQRIQDAEIRMLPQPVPLISSHDLKRVPIESNIAERFKQQQKQSLSETDGKQQGYGMPQRFKKLWPLNPEGADLETLLPPRYYEASSEEDDLNTLLSTDKKNNNLIENETYNVPTKTPASSSSFESPFNLQPDRLNALLKAKPKKSCLKNPVLLKNRNDSTIPVNREIYSTIEEQHGYEADYETQSDESLEQTTSECTTEEHHHLIEQSSIDTLTDVWYRAGEDQQAIMATASIPATPPRLTGGLYSQVDKLKFQPIDKLDAGSAGTPILDEHGARTANERIAYFVTEFAKLTREDRAKDIELRMGQLRLLQATSDRRYRRYLKANGFLNWRQLNSVAIDSLKHSCPLAGTCSKNCPLLLYESLLAHFIESHLFEPGMELCEIFERDRLLIIFNPRSFDLGKNVCMSVIVYGGFRDSPYSLPIMRCMPVYNVGLSHAYTRFAGHLPLFVLICRNRLSAIDSYNDQGNYSSSSTSSNSSSKKVRFNDQLDPNTLSSNGQGQADFKTDEDVLALWVVSMELPQPIHVLMTVFNRRLDITRSSIMKVRSLNKSHDCTEFMNTSEHYMRLTELEMRILTYDYTEPIYMELSVREYAALYPTETISALR